GPGLHRCAEPRVRIEHEELETVRSVDQEPVDAGRSVGIADVAKPPRHAGEARMDDGALGRGPRRDDRAAAEGVSENDLVGEDEGREALTGDEAMGCDVPPDAGGGDV